MAFCNNTHFLAGNITLYIVALTQFNEEIVTGVRKRGYD